MSACFPSCRYLSLLPGIDNVSALRTFRVLRPLRTLTRFDGMRIIVQAMLASIPALFNVFLLCAFIFVVFGIIGVQLWSGVLRGRCFFLDPEGNHIMHPDELFCALSCEQFPTTCTYTFGQGCPAYNGLFTNSTTGQAQVASMPGICANHGNPNFGITGFDNIGSACLTIFTSITLEGWVDIMYALTRAWGLQVAVAAYFVLLIMLGSFFLLNLALAVIWDEYESAATEQQGRQRELIDTLVEELEAEVASMKNGPVAHTASAEAWTSSSLVDTGVPSSRQKRDGPKDSLPISIGGATPNTSVARASGPQPTRNGAKTCQSSNNRKVSPAISGDCAIGPPPVISHPSLRSKPPVLAVPNGNAALALGGSGDLTLSSLNRLPSIWKYTSSDRRKMGLCTRVANSPALELGVSVLIMLNTTTLAMEFHGMTDVYTDALTICNYVFAAAFTIEMIVKLNGLGPRAYARSAFNVFDAVVVTISLVEITLSLVASGTASGLSALRTFRLMRVFKLAKTWKNLQRLLVTIVRSVVDVANASVVLLIVLFIFVLMGMQLFGGRFTIEAFDGNEDDLPRAHFDNFWWAFVTVFQVLTGENWNEVLYAAVKAVGDIGIVYFVALNVVGNYLILNLFLAILLGNFERASKDEAADKAILRSQEAEAVSGRSAPFALGNAVGVASAGGEDATFTDAKSAHSLTGPAELTVVKRQPACRAMPRAAGASVQEDGSVAAIATNVLVSQSSLAAQVARHVSAPSTANCAGSSEKAPKAVSEDGQEHTRLQPRRSSSASPCSPRTGTVPAPKQPAMPNFRHRAAAAASSLRSSGGRTQLDDTSANSDMVGFRTDAMPPALPPVVLRGRRPTPFAAAVTSTAPSGGTSTFATKNDHAELPVPSGPMTASCISPQSQRAGDSPSFAGGAIASPQPSPPLKPQKGVVFENRNESVSEALPANASAIRQAGSASTTQSKSVVWKFESVDVDGSPPLSSALPSPASASPDRRVRSVAPGSQPGLSDGAALRASGLRSSMQKQGSQLVGVSMLYGRQSSGTSRVTTTIRDDLGRELAVRITKSGDVSVAKKAHDGVQSSDINDRQPARPNVSASAAEPAEWPKHFSLCVFSPTNPLRVGAYRLVGHPWFDKTILFLIAVSSVLLALDEPSVAVCSRRPASDPANCIALGGFLFWADVVLTVLFTLEMVVKIITATLKGYLRSGWNILDFIIVAVSIASIVLGGASSLKALRSLRALRALRPLRVVSRYPSLKLVVNSIFGALPKVSNVALVNFLFFLIFAIVGVQNFMGALNSCNDPNATTKAECVGQFNATGSLCSLLPTEARIQACTVSSMGSPFPRLWHPPPYNFDNVFNALLTVFEIATGEMWPDIMYLCVDAVGPDLPLQHDNQPAAALYFVFIQVVCAFFMLEVFTGVIIDNFNKLKAESKGSGLLTDEQQRLVESLKMMLTVRPRRVMRRPPSHTCTGRFRGVLFTIAESQAFDIIVMGVIMINTVFMASRFYGQPTEWEEALAVVNVIFNVFFTSEAVVKLGGLGLHQYFTLGWNRFDFALVLGGWVGIGVDIGPVATIFRIFRVARIFRLVRTSKGLLQLLRTLIISIPSLLNVGALLVLLLFIYACVGMNLFSDVKHGEFINGNANFESFGTAMITLFRASTGESYNGIMHDAMLQPPYCDPETNCGDALLAPLYFLSFYIVSAFVMLNLLVAIILDNFDDTKHAGDVMLGFKLTEAMSENFQATWSLLDPEGKGILSHESLVQLVCLLKYPLGLRDHPGMPHDEERPPEVDSADGKTVRVYRTRRQVAANMISELHLQSIDGDKYEFQIVLQALLNNASDDDWRLGEITVAPELHVEGGHFRILGGLRQTIAARRIQGVWRSKAAWQHQVGMDESRLGRKLTKHELAKVAAKHRPTIDKHTLAMMFAAGAAQAASIAVAEGDRVDEHAG